MSEEKEKRFGIVSYYDESKGGEIIARAKRMSISKSKFIETIVVRFLDSGDKLEIRESE